MDIKAVLFDCDGTMFDTEIVSQRMWQETAAKYGITLPDDFFLKITGGGSFNQFYEIPGFEQYVKDMMAKENGGVIPSDKEVKNRMDSLDPYISEGLTDIKDMLKAQKAEQYGVSSKQAAIIAAIGKEKGINADILNDDKKCAARTLNLKQEFVNKGKTEAEATKLADHTINILKVQNGVANNLGKPSIKK